MNALDPIAVARLIASTVESLGIPYMIGGSLASSRVGEPRSSLDVDIVVDADVMAVTRLVEALKETFYVDLQSAIDAVHLRRSFNVIHFGSAIKVDIFILENFPPARRQLDRRELVVKSSDRLDGLWFYTPEDIIVRKLHWYRLGGEVSERQWRDVLGVIKANTGRLDRVYLRESAESFSVLDLLVDVAREAGGVL